MLLQRHFRRHQIPSQATAGIHKSHKVTEAMHRWVALRYHLWKKTVILFARSWRCINNLCREAEHGPDVRRQHYKSQEKRAVPHCFMGYMPPQTIAVVRTGTNLQPFIPEPVEEHCLGNLLPNQVTRKGSCEWLLQHDLLLQNQVQLLEPPYSSATELLKY